MGMSDAEFQKSLGEKIGAIRLEKDLSVRKLALLADMEHHQLLKVEKGSVDIRLSTLRKLATALAVRERDLLDF